MEKKIVTDIDIARKMVGVFESAATRNIYFSLSLEKIRELLLIDKCYYTNIEFTESGDFSRTFDRVNNSRGYTDDNVVACTKIFNEKKGRLTFEDVKILYNALKPKDEWKNIENSAYSISKEGIIKNTKTNFLVKNNKGRVSIYLNKKTKNLKIESLLTQYFPTQNLLKVLSKQSIEIDKKQEEEIKKNYNLKEEIIFKDKNNKYFVFIAELKFCFVGYKLLKSNIVDVKEKIRIKREGCFKYGKMTVKYPTDFNNVHTHLI